MRNLLFLNLSAAIIMTACVGNVKNHLQVESKIGVSLIQKKDIIVLPLAIRYVSFSRRQQTKNKHFETKYRDHVNKLLITNFSKQTRSLGFHKVQKPEKPRLNFFGSNSIFSKRKLSPSGLSGFSNVCKRNHKAVLFAHSIEIKLGKQGYWNPVSGSTGPNTSSSYYRLAVFDCGLNERVWFGSVFFRKVANVENSTLPLIKIYRKLYNAMGYKNEK